MVSTVVMGWDAGWLVCRLYARSFFFRFQFLSVRMVFSLAGGGEGRRLAGQGDQRGLFTTGT